MTPNEIAPRLAEAVLRKIEETKRIVKSEITDAIEAELLRCTPQTSVFSMLDRPSLSQDGEPLLLQTAWLDMSSDAELIRLDRILCGND